MYVDVTSLFDRIQTVSETNQLNYYDSYVYYC